jgi:hypothetical protein
MVRLLIGKWQGTCLQVLRKNPFLNLKSPSKFVETSGGLQI